MPDPNERPAYAEIEGNLLDAPGTAAYHPGSVIFTTRSGQASRPNSAPGYLGEYPTLNIPSPNIGGIMRQAIALGFSRGLNVAFRASPFRGRVLSARPAGAHPREGHVGLMTRTTARNYAALTTDYTPTVSRVAPEILSYAG